MVVKACLVYKKVIVVAEYIALANLAVGVVDIILYMVAAWAEVTDRELVDVGIFVCSHQVVHGLVVHSLCCSNLQAHGTLVETVVVDVEGRTKVECQLVIVTTLHIVETLAACGICLLVGKVHIVPVELAVGLARSPVLVACVVVGKLVIGGSVVQVPNVIRCTWQVLVVVWTWVGSVAVPAESRCAVH